MMSADSRTNAHADEAVSLRTRAPKSEAGYTLFALLAVMTAIAISLTAVAPSLKQQAQRERELEAIRRGEEVADAIRLYKLATKYTKAPTSIKDLLEGAPVPGRTKKVQVLRSSAARDPLTGDGEWREIRRSATNSAMCNFVGALTRYNDGKPPEASQQYQDVMQRCVSQIAGAVNGLGALTSADDSDDESSGGGELIGVASRSRARSVVTYYGIEQHNNWVFTPAVPKLD